MFALTVFAAPIVPRDANCYFRPMIGIAELRMRRRLPTSEGFAKLSDRARLPGRFFYRLTTIAGF